MSRVRYCFLAVMIRCAFFLFLLIRVISAVEMRTDDDFEPIIIPTKPPSAPQPQKTNNPPVYSPRVYSPSNYICPSHDSTRKLQPLAAGEHEEGWVAPTVPDDEPGQGALLPAGEHEEGWVAPTVPDDEPGPGALLPAGEHEEGWVAPTVPDDPDDTLAVNKKSFRPHEAGVDTIDSRDKPHTTQLPDADNYEGVMSSNGQIWYLSGIILCAVVVLLW